MSLKLLSCLNFGLISIFHYYILSTWKLSSNNFHLNKLLARSAATEIRKEAMTIMDTEDILIKLRELKPIITVRYKVKEIGIFGSFVRGEQGAGSDIDVLVDFEEGADLFDLIGLTLYLEETLQRKVDVVPKRALRVEIQKSVLHEVVAL